MSENALLWIIGLPLAAGVLTSCIPRRAGVLAKLVAVAVTAVCFALAIRVFVAKADLAVAAPTWWRGAVASVAGIAAGPHVLVSGSLARLVLMGAGFFALAMIVYSLGTKRRARDGAFYANVLWAVGATFGVILSADLLVLLAFWGFMGIPFFLLVNMGTEGGDAAAKKTLIVLGGTDSLMILGLGLLFITTRSTAMNGSAYPVALSSGGPICACLFLAIAAFAKAGAMPFHSWVPDAAETAPVSAVALLPASLDKLLGIYLFTRICLDLFRLTVAVQVIFLLLGAVTILAAVFAALIQHNLRRLLGFHAVSQVGYMVIGVATLTPIGVLGGLFHMFNNAIYKALLFLSAGAAERRAKTGNLALMGGLGRAMPVTFTCAMIAALAISGVPPLNGFASKWMVYQGLIEAKGTLSVVWAAALVAAMFGSALTLASFVKVIHAVFLGQPRREDIPYGPKPNAWMGAPMVALALLCLFLGIFAVPVPVSRFLAPAVPAMAAFEEIGLWQSGAATVLLLLGIVLGLLILWVSRLKVREDTSYVGGEIGAAAEPFRFQGTEFYRTVAEMGGLRRLYRRMEEQWFDLYHVGRRAVFYVTGGLRALHSGVLLTYLAWCVLGVVVLLWLVK